MNTRKSQSGVAIIEVLVACIALALVSIAVTGLVVVATRSSVQSERQVVALSQVNSVLESVRAMDYEDIGYTHPLGIEPDGLLERHLAITPDNQPYAQDVSIELVDDPANGHLQPGTLSESTADYKKVTVNISWGTASGGSRDVTQTVIVTPQSSCVARCTPNQSQACPDPNKVGDVGFGVDACGYGLQNPNFIPNTVTCPSTGICPPPPCPPGTIYCPTPTPSPSCPPGGTCCDAAADCSTGDVCNPDSGMCEPPCSATSCNGGNVCNPDSGLCNPPCSEGGGTCGSGYECNPASNLCEIIPNTTPNPSQPVGSPTPPPEGTPAGTPPPGTTPEPPSCTNDQQCSGGGTCQNGRCTPSTLFNPCGADSECNAGQACLDGTCQGAWCPVPGVFLGCSSAVVDPGCFCPNIFGGRYVTRFQQAEQAGNQDPWCNLQVTQFCQPIWEWVDCPNNCPTSTP
ncbi:MAG: hypothetical protein HYZ63_02325 [Candidatus Andersenbacteria bacterium]|nr:hypothetical protein [Candidatus Andersenbacteria bacterium]